MKEYIDILLTSDGFFCAAPPWSVKEGDWISFPAAITGGSEMHKVISVATDAVDGEFLTMIKRHIGYPLPEITAKYCKSEVNWDAVNDDR